MKKLLILNFLMAIAIVSSSQIPYKMEELTAPRFVKAVELSGGVCIIPLGIIEKHGPHLPLGSDLFEAREIAFKAAEKEYAVVFPPYFTGQILEGRHHPGTIAYSTDLMWKMLDETCRELARNGLKKIVLMNGHGGNNAFVQYFCQAQLASARDYIVVLFRPGQDPEYDKQIRSLKKAKIDGHAGEEETSMMSVIRPDIVDLDAIKTESGLDQKRIEKLSNGYTGIWWYGQFPNHFAGDVVEANKKLGELLIASDAKQLAELVKFLKTDNTIEDLQEEFFKRGEEPLK